MVPDADARRVALLARPGLARERLNGVLQEAGANCVIAADPTQLTPDDLRHAQPQVVLVALDPVTEEVLEQFDEVLGDRAVEVIYEEAEQAASREGWDAARWQRHLVAKLQGHSNVLPPGHEPAAPAVAITAPAQAHASAPAAANVFDPVSAELEGFELDVDFGSSLPELSLPELSPSEQAPLEQAPLEPVSLELDPAVPAEPSAPFGDLEISFEGDAADPASSSADDDFSSFDFTLDTGIDGVPASGSAAGAFDGLDAIGPFDPLNAEVADDAVAIVQPGEAAEEGPAASGGLSLHDDEAPMRAPATPGSRDGFRRDLVDLEQRISSMSLVDDTPRQAPETARGAVLILAGLGGPDAVRQLLGALPVGFARPVLVQQRLEGGRYDRLVTQLQRATKLTVALAEPAQAAEPGTVYILPDTLGATSSAEGIRFSDDANDAVMAALPSADSAVLLLSGSDPAHVEAAMVHSRAGALVAGQAAEGCYDAAAPNALVASGGEAAAPAALALRLSERWSIRGSSNVQA